MATTDKPEIVNCKNLLITGLSRLFNDETTSDITLVVGNKRYAVHKNILASSSEYFHRLFYGSEWKESNQAEIDLKETPDYVVVFDTFIQYFYTGTIELCLETIPFLLTLADKYAAAIKQTCIDFMMKTINKGDLDMALAWIPLFKQLKVDDVLERCYAIICYNLEKVSKLPEWATLSLHDLSVILQRRDIIIKSEYNMYEAVQGWVKAQVSCQTEKVEDLLSYVEFKNMTAVELSEVEQSTLAKGEASLIVDLHLNEAFRYLALKAERQKNGETNISRIYTQGGVFQNVEFSYHGLKKLEVRGCSQYEWFLSYTHKPNGDTLFTVTPKEVEYSTVRQHQMHGYTQSVIKAKPKHIMICILNSDKTIFKLIAKTSTQIQVSAVTISVKGVHIEPNRCLVSLVV